MRMKKLALNLVGFALFSAGAVMADPPEIVGVGPAVYKFSDRRFADVFKKTLSFGHSVSSDFMHQSVLNPGGAGTMLATRYAQLEPLANISEVAGIMETGLSKMLRWNDQIQDTRAKPDSNRDLNKMNSLLNEATVIIGIDALYMSVAFNECASYSDIPDILKTFVTNAARDGKVTILGNVPKENRAQFSWLARQAIPAMNEGCRRDMNLALKNACTYELNCYVVDLEKMVEQLNTTGKLTLNEGTELVDDYTPKGRRDVRWDGVNLTDRGVQYLVENILNDMAAHPAQAIDPKSLTKP